jgi:hypothetical protein
MKHDYVKSDPTFFRMILLSMGLCAAVLVLLAWFIAAPLQEAADLSRVPNPSRSAWFLLWMQELVSYSNSFVYLIIALGGFFCLLPWLPRTQAATWAIWFPKDQWPINLATVISFALIVLLTIIALYFRGENWSFIWPF